MENKSKSRKSSRIFSVEDELREYWYHGRRPSLLSIHVEYRDLLTGLLGDKNTPQEMRREITKMILQAAKTTGVTLAHHRLIGAVYTELIHSFRNMDTLTPLHKRNKRAERASQQLFQLEKILDDCLKERQRLRDISELEIEQALSSIETATLAEGEAGQ